MEHSTFQDLSFDCVIPSAILVNDNIELTAVKLFAFIKSLTRLHGYCYATNEYLANLMKSTSRAVQNWLVQLRDQGYVDIETDKKGVHWQRRIYISDRFKKSLRKEPQFTPPRTTVQPPLNHGSPILEENIKEEELRKIPPHAAHGTPPKGKSASPPSAEAESLTEFFLESLLKRNQMMKMPDKAKWVKEFDRMLRIDKRDPLSIKLIIKWSEDAKFFSGHVNCPERLRKKFDEMWMTMTAEEKQNTSSKNKQFCLELKKKYPEKMASLVMTAKFASNSDNQKEIPFDLPCEQFQSTLIHIFGGQ